MDCSHDACNDLISHVDDKWYRKYVNQMKVNSTPKTTIFEWIFEYESSMHSLITIGQIFLFLRKTPKFFLLFYLMTFNKINGTIQSKTKDSSIVNVISECLRHMCTVNQNHSLHHWKHICKRCSTSDISFQFYLFFRTAVKIGYLCSEKR